MKHIEGEEAWVRRSKTRQGWRQNLPLLPNVSAAAELSLYA